MKSFLALITVIATVTVIPPLLRAEFAVSVPKQCHISEEITRSVLHGGGKTEHQLEISKQYRDYAVNPVAMKRFLSFEQALLRKFGFPMKSSPADQNFTEQEIYRARIDGTSEDGSVRVTVLLLGSKKQFIAVRVQTTEGSASDHDLFVAKIKIEEDGKQEAQQVMDVNRP